MSRFVIRHQGLFAAAAIGVLAFAVRLHGLGDKPYWLDELITVQRANHDLWGVVIDSFRNRHFPTYFLLVSLLLPWGLQEAVVRLPSVLFGALSASFTCAVGNRLGGIRAGFLGGSLMALAPFQVQMGQEARSYALITCLIMMALWGLVVLMETAPAGEGRIRILPWIAYAGGTLGALITLPIAIPWFVAANLAVFAIRRGHDQASRLFRRRWLVAQGAILLIAAPVIAGLVLVAHSSLTHGFDWVPRTPYDNLVSSLATAYLMRASTFVTVDLLPTPLPWLGAVVLLLAALGAWTLRRRRQALALLAIAVLALPVTLLAISVFKSVLVPRYFAWGAAPFFVLAGLGVMALPQRWQTAVCCVICLLAVPNLAPYYAAETKPRWDMAAADLAQRLERGDVILTGDEYTAPILTAFSDRQGTPMPTVTVVRDVSAAAAQLAQNHRVWAIYGRVGQGAMESYQAFLDRVAPLGQPAMQMAEGNHIHILMFDPPERDTMTDRDRDGGTEATQQ